ncbi:MAG: hypothetical protein ACRDZ9_05075 [Acidimicrobiales bacterium]
MTVTSVLALTITWDPTIRGALVVAVAVVILCGSPYLLMGTNLGSRLGFLVAAAALSGWMMVMGAVWWVYGIGYKGPAPTWQVTEVVTSSSPGDLAAAALDRAHDLSAWEELPEGNTVRGEAQASATEALVGEESRVKTFDAESDFVVIDAFETGGKDPDSFWSNLPLPHPPHYAIIQAQAAKEVEVKLGEAPPPAEPDPSAAVESVIMVRDLGAVRLPPAVFTLSMALVFGVSCNVLHRRDKAAASAAAKANT